MYLNHYNLKEKPFNISPDSRFLWMSDKHKEGLASLKYGVMENKGFLVLTGDIGTGKTLLINALIRITKVKALIATIPDPDLEIMDFFMLLAEEFNMPNTFASKGEFLVQFKQFLLESYASDKTVLLIVDEAQNLTPHEVKTIITRAGEGTKIVFTGDVHQIDTPYLDSQSNGMSYLIDRVKDHPLYAHIKLEKGERSELANLANELL